MKLRTFFTNIHLKDFISGVITMIIGAIMIILILQKVTNEDTKSTIGSEKFPNTQLVTSGKITSPQGVDINIYVASTEKQRSNGLSGFKTLPPNTGMLFVFPQLGIYNFWMKDMNFALDIIWFDESMQIVDQVINTKPQDYPETYIPKAAAKYVLEIPANTAEMYGFSIGKKVFLTHNE